MRIILLVPSNFYCATLSASAVFAVVRVSVRLSVRLVDCIHAAEDIVKLLNRPGSPITLFIWPHALTRNSKRNPFSRDAKYTWWENLRFSTEITVCLGNGTR